MVEIIGYIVAGLFSIAGVVITNAAGNKNIMSKLETRIAVFEAKIDQLNKRQDESSPVLGKVPTIEKEVESLEKRVDRIEERVHNLETSV